MPELRMRVVVLVAIAVAVSNGIGVAPTPELSAELIALHEQAGHRETEAQVSLGFKCRRGEGVLQNGVAAARWFRAAAAQGDAEAQYSLGFMYGDGLDLSGGPERAVPSGRCPRPISPKPGDARVSGDRRPRLGDRSTTNARRRSSDGTTRRLSVDGVQSTNRRILVQPNMSARSSIEFVGGRKRGGFRPV